jgi:hypothetical protein
MGATYGGVYGAAIGAVAGGIYGGVQGSKLKKQREAYEKAEGAIPLQDANMVNFLGKVQRRRTALEAGTDAYTQNRIGNANNALAQTQANIVRQGRGNISDLLRSQAVTDRVIGDAGADANRSALSLLGTEGSFIQSMADRLYNRQDSRTNVLWQEYARKREDMNRNLTASLGLLPQITAGGSDEEGFGGFIGKQRRNLAGQPATMMQPRVTMPQRSALSYTPQG